MNGPTAGALLPRILFSPVSPLRAFGLGSGFGHYPTVANTAGGLPFFTDARMPPVYQRGAADTCLADRLHLCYGATGAWQRAFRKWPSTIFRLHIAPVELMLRGRFTVRYMPRVGCQMQETRQVRTAGFPFYCCNLFNSSARKTILGILLVPASHL
jgi:hypothetical protein